MSAKFTQIARMPQKFLFSDQVPVLRQRQKKEEAGTD
jgi:hypothetical protein